jgi:Pin2-interacting protein X1
MASKYRDRLLENSGVSNIRFECDYSKKLMVSMGWKEGSGLGKNQSGVKDCVQVRRRDDGVGLGKKALGGPTNWKDDWWKDAFDGPMKRLVIVPDKFKKKE